MEGGTEGKRKNRNEGREEILVRLGAKSIQKHTCDIYQVRRFISLRRKTEMKDRRLHGASGRTKACRSTFVLLFSETWILVLRDGRISNENARKREREFFMLGNGELFSVLRGDSVNRRRSYRRVSADYLPFDKDFL